MSLLRRIEPTILDRKLCSDEVDDIITEIASLPKDTFGPVIVHPQDSFFPHMKGMKYGIVVNFPSGGDLLGRALQTINDMPDPNVVDVCMRTPRPAALNVGGRSNEATLAIKELAYFVDGYELDKRAIRLLYDCPLIDYDTIDSICAAAKAYGFEWIKTSTGVYSKTTVEETSRIVSIAQKYGISVKSAGGIKTYADAKAHIKAGARLVGTSSFMQIYKEATHIDADSDNN